jgi:hypothetical protein
MIPHRALASTPLNSRQSQLIPCSQQLCVFARSQQQQQQQRKGSKVPQQTAQASLRGVSTLTVDKPAGSSTSDCTCPEPCSDGAAGAASPSALTAAANSPWAGPLFVACGAFVCSFISLQVTAYINPDCCLVHAIWHDLCVTKAAAVSAGGGVHHVAAPCCCAYAAAHMLLRTCWRTCSAHHAHASISN